MVVTRDTSFSRAADAINANTYTMGSVYLHRAICTGSFLPVNRAYNGGGCFRIREELALSFFNPNCICNTAQPVYPGFLEGNRFAQKESQS